MLDGGLGTPAYRLIGAYGDRQGLKLDFMSGVTGNRLRALNHHGVNGIALWRQLGGTAGRLPNAALEGVAVRLEEAHGFDALTIDAAHVPVSEGLTRYLM
jgi:hypothetical protein